MFDLDLLQVNVMGGELTAPSAGSTSGTEPVRMAPCHGNGEEQEWTHSR